MRKFLYKDYILRNGVPIFVAFLFMTLIGDSFILPFIFQATENSNRPITPVAKVKGVFIKDSDGVVKASTKVFVKKDSSTVEKIHQVPALPFDE